MEEGQVGIDVYTTATSGFTGILKHRYTDFQVFEIDVSGRTAHLTSTEPPAQDVPAAPAAGAVELTDAAIADATAAFSSIAGADNGALLAALLAGVRQHKQQRQQQQQADAAAAQGPAAGAGAQEQQQQQQEQQQQQPPVLQVDMLPVESKDTRKAMHQFLKTDPRLPPLQTDTVAAPAPAAAAAAAAGEAGNGSGPVHNIIRVRLAGSGGQGQRGGGQERPGQKRGRRGAQQQASGWREAPPAWEGGPDNKHARFVMLKENMDTQAALTVIGRMLHCSSRDFGFAGTKDKRGVTTQWVTLLRTPPARLAALNSRLRGIKLGNFEFAPQPLQLGQLRGNRFRLLMRDVSSSDDEHIAAAVAEVRTKGFVNYFGLQRFGTGAVPTHRVGGALLRGEWQAAVQLIMQGSPDERPELRAARDLYLHKGDIQGSLKALPSFLVAERAVLSVLGRAGASAHLNALQAIPRTLRSMYLHAWQSWLWNRAASERVRRFGATEVVAGDLVLLGSAEQQQGSEAEQGGDAGGDAAAAALEAATAGNRLAAVHEVTAAEAAARVFSVLDVVLPLPGGSVRYPRHAAGWPLYCALAAADGVCLPGMSGADAAAAAAAAAAASADAAGDSSGSGSGSSVDLAGSGGAKLAAHGAKEFQLSGMTGDYRRLLHVPSDLCHRVLRYSEAQMDDDGLLPTDWGALQQQQQGQARPPKRHKAEGEGAHAGGSEQPQQAAAGAASEPGGAAAVVPAAAAAAAAADEAAAGEAAVARQLVGVVLEFTLPSSCYATMLVRELTKSSTSKAAHREMSVRGQQQQQQQLQQQQEVPAAAAGAAS